MKDLFRSTDNFKAYWQAGGGICQFAFERGGQLFVYTIINGRMVYDARAFESNRDIDIMNISLSQIGFVFRPVFQSYEIAKKTGVLASLEADFEIYQKGLEKQQEEAEKKKLEVVKGKESKGEQKDK